MADDQSTSERLEALKTRWESDKGSRIFLQLADEYRRLGREEDAVKVLDEGLEVNPGHVGARVARGRSLLALGRAGEATSDLEKVIEADPTQMVAYRFLVEGYIQQGAADQARQRLSVYGLLNDSDPDIEELDRKIRELERSDRTGAWPMPNDEQATATPIEAAVPEPPPATPPAAAPPAAPPAAEAAPPEEPFPESSPVVPEDPFGELPTPEDEEPFAAAPVEPPQRVTKAPDPFPSLTIPEDRRRYLEGFDEELFGSPGATATPDESEPREIELLETAEEPAPPEPRDEPFDPVPSPPSAPESEPFNLMAPPRAEAPDLGALLAPEAETEEATEPPEAPEPQDAPVPAEPPAQAPAVEASPAVAETRSVAEPAEPLGVTELAEPDDSFEALEEPAAVVSTDPSEPIAATEPTVPSEPAVSTEAEEVAEPEAPAVAAEPPASEPPASEPAADQGRATVTLGRLYLRQGHLQEAEESFREVLERDPDNAEAQQGLAEVAAHQAPGLEVRDLLEGYRPGEHGEGLTARKRFALRQYLERLRGGGADVH